MVAVFIPSVVTFIHGMFQIYPEQLNIRLRTTKDRDGALDLDI